MYSVKRLVHSTRKIDIIVFSMSVEDITAEALGIWSSCVTARQQGALGGPCEHGPENLSYIIFSISLTIK